MSKIIQILVLYLVFVFTFKFFQSTIIEESFFIWQAAFYVLLAVFLIYYGIAYIFGKEKVRGVAVYYYLLMLLVPALSGLMALKNFEQPFYYGFLAERQWISFGVAILIYYWLIKAKVSMHTIEVSFVSMAWISLIFYVAYILTFDRGQIYNPLESTFVQVSDEPVRGLRFKFQSYFIVFGVLYYFIKSIISKKVNSIAFSFVFLLYIVLVVKGRSTMLALSAIFFIFYVKNMASKKALLYLFTFFLLFSVGFALVKYQLPDYYEKMADLFEQMLIVLTGEESSDMSANSRIYQSQTIYDYFEANPESLWLGVGALSNRWNDGGFVSVFGYLYPSDTGVLGGVFLYGIVGAIFICLVPFLITCKVLLQMLKINRRIELQRKNVFCETLSYLMLFYIIKLPQGSYFFSFAAYAIPLFILMAYLELRKRAR